MPLPLSRDLEDPATALRADLAPASAAETSGVDPLLRTVAWAAMLICSALPNIVWQIDRHEAPAALPFGQIATVFLLALIASRIRRLRPLAGFLVTIGIVRLSWYVIAPTISNAEPMRQFTAQLSWGARMFISRLLLTSGALLMVATFALRGFNRRNLFLRVGQLDAAAQPEVGLWFRRPVSWLRLGPELLLIFGVVLPVCLYFTLHPDLAQLGRVWRLWPWALATAALNAANEEFQFRCVPLARLRGALPMSETLWLTAIFFGLGHYFGQPSGLLGVLMATIAGWLWAKSMVETRGAGWAFAIHMVQDIVIFSFLAVSSAS